MSLLALASTAPALLVLIALAAFAGRGSQRTGALVYVASASVMAALAVIGLAFLSSASTTQSMALPLGLAGQASALRLDPLTAFFLIVLGIGGAAACAHAIGSGRDEPRPGRVLPLVPLFLAAMTIVLLADDGYAFLFGWESMSLASWALVVARPRDPDNARAGHLYLVMAGIGTAALLFAFATLASSAGGLTFDAVRAMPPSGAVASAVVLLALLGCGSKAGLVPLHAWLPLAHPAAPSHVSALMSGVMTKIAVYAFLRIAFDLLGPPEWWWGAIAMTIGAATAVMGLLYAIFDGELKRLLAYSTVENIGIAFAGIGLALAFSADGDGLGTALALSATLLHVLNHMLMKSLLFLGAGNVLHATGTGRLDRLGGLIHTMPRTAVLVLLGAAAISALPPLNGFAAEWLLFQAILASPGLQPWLLKFLVPAIGAMLALAAALAAACFVRAYGVAFLGRPRSAEAAHAHEVDPWSLGSMSVLASLCVAIGIVPGAVLDLLAPVTAMLAGGASLPTQITQPWLTLVPTGDRHGSYNGLVILAFIAISGSLTALVIRRFGRGDTRRAPAWDCGFPVPTPVTQYGAGSFAQPLRRVFGPTLFRASEEVDMPAAGDLGTARHRVRIHDVAWEALYLPAGRLVGWSAAQLNTAQSLTIRGYLSLVFATLILLLIVVAAW